MGRVKETAVVLGGQPAVIVRPANAVALYVFAHGAGAGMRHAFMEQMAQALAVQKIGTVRWEFPYMAAGKRAPDRPPVAQAAVRDVWQATQVRFGDLPLFAGGKSFGGRMTSGAHAAERLPDLRGLVFMGFPLYGAGKEPSTERADHLASAAGPILFVQGTRDELAALPTLRPVVTRLGKRATLHVVEGADHGFDVLARSGRTGAEVRAEIAGAVAAWMRDRIR